MPAQLGGLSVFLDYLTLCILHFLIFFVIQPLVLSSISSELSSSSLMMDEVCQAPTLLLCALKCQGRPSLLWLVLE